MHAKLLWPTCLFVPSLNGHRLLRLSKLHIYFLLLPCIQTFGCYFFWPSVDLLLIACHLIYCSPASQIMKSIRIVYKVKLLIKVRILLPVLLVLLQSKVHGLCDSSFDLSKTTDKSDVATV